MFETLWNDAPMWVVWLAQFFAIELPALYNAKRGDTLSEVIRYIFGFSTRFAGNQSLGMKARRGSFYAVSAWFVLHIQGIL